jgi:hypothetical protein
MVNFQTGVKVLSPACNRADTEAFVVLELMPLHDQEAMYWLVALKTQVVFKLELQLDDLDNFLNFLYFVLLLGCAEAAEDFLVADFC